MTIIKKKIKIDTDNLEGSICDAVKNIIAELKGKEKKDYDWKDIISYEKAVEAMPVQKEDALYEKDSKRDRACKMIRHIIYVINKGWIADLRDSNQQKWYCWFKVASSGFRFGASLCGYDNTHTIVGVRLCIENKEKADFIGNGFLPIWQDYLT